ncbi:MBL fold metallo-hydrolase [Leuconostoc mesenteroides]|uniref:MBL fold metallo-hydrolase n=1 Tax=Leuconostoc mesenteroides TaxID=1245 RepID=UPI0023626F7C|nr:MBL fold metallo-hydrolase [Leuconostoc mesenteroides]
MFGLILQSTKYKNLYQLTWAPMLFPINCYLWENDDDIIVIDMGVKSFVSEIKKIAERLNKPISSLLLTHAHADHVNGVPLFHKIFPNVPIGISDRDFQLLNGDFSLLSNEAKSKIKGGFSKDSIHIDFTLKKMNTIIFILLNLPDIHRGQYLFLKKNQKF